MKRLKLKLYLKDRRSRLGEILEEDILFCTEYNHIQRSMRAKKPLTQRELQLIIKEAARKADIKDWKNVFPHCLRKTFDSFLRTQFADGGRLDLKTQEYFMGHLLGGSMDRYFDKTKTEELRREYAKLIFKPREQTCLEALDSLKSIAELLGVDFVRLEDSKKKELGRSLVDLEKLKLIQEAIKRVAAAFRNIHGAQLSGQSTFRQELRVDSSLGHTDTFSPTGGNVETAVEDCENQDVPVELSCLLRIQSPPYLLNGTKLFFSATLTPYVLDSQSASGINRSFFSVEAIEQYLKLGSEIIDTKNGDSEGNALIGRLPSPLNKAETICLKWNIEDLRFYAQQK